MLKSRIKMKIIKAMAAPYPKWKYKKVSLYKSRVTV
jgi:hypothetical protein